MENWPKTNSNGLITLPCLKSMVTRTLANLLLYISCYGTDFLLKVVVCVAWIQSDLRHLVMLYKSF